MCLLQIPGDCIGAEPDSGPVLGEVIADLVTLGHDARHERLPVFYSVRDEKEGRLHPVLPEVSQD